MFVPYVVIKLLFVLGSGSVVVNSLLLPPLCEWGLWLFLML